MVPEKDCWVCIYILYIYVKQLILNVHIGQGHGKVLSA